MDVLRIGKAINKKNVPNNMDAADNTVLTFV